MAAESKDAGPPSYLYDRAESSALLSWCVTSSPWGGKRLCRGKTRGKRGVGARWGAGGTGLSMRGGSPQPTPCVHKATRASTHPPTPYGPSHQQQALQLREAVAGHQLAWAKAVVEHDGLSAAAAVAGAGRCRRRCPARRLSWPREQGAALSGQVALHQRQARRRQHGQPCAVRQRELPHHLGVAVRLEAQGSRRIAHPARQPAAGAWSTVTTEVREKLGIGGKVYRDWFIQPHTAPLMRKKQYRSGLAWQIGRSSSALQRQPSAPMQHPCTYTLVMGR